MDDDHAAIETDLAALSLTTTTTTTRCDDDDEDDEEEKDQRRKSNNSNNHGHHRITTTTTLVCDLQYGFPNERRPRREKIGALAAQLGNFFDWQEQRTQMMMKMQHHDDDGGCSEEANRERTQNQLLLPAAVLLVHLAQDDDAVTEILDRLRQKQQGQLLVFAFGEEAEKGNIMNGTTTNDERLPHPSADRNQQRPQPRPGRIGRTTKPLKLVVDAMKGRIIYLSPDADTVLSSSSLFFSNDDTTKDHENNKTDDDDFRTTTTFDNTNNVLSCIIVGGLIDRRHIQTNRSLSRAMELDIPTARWPLPKPVPANNPIMVDNNDNNDTNNYWDPHEPLNVDCILQGMQDWLWTGDLSTSIANALDAHVQRHPGRPRHKTNQPTNQPTNNDSSGQQPRYIVSS
jgi:hypothetical protein